MSLDVAKTILDQLGGRRFEAMTGAKDFIGSPNSLSFRFPRSINKDGRAVNGFRIVLDPSDTYSVEAICLRGSTRNVVATMSDVYCDMLREVFTTMTGLYTRF